MAKYVIDSRFWDDDKVTALVDEHGYSNLLQYQILQVLLCGPMRTSLPGLQRANAETIAEVIRQPSDVVRQALADLCERFPTMIQVDERARVVRLPNAPKHNTYGGPRNVQSWFSAWKHLPESQLKYDHIPSLMNELDFSKVPTVDKWNETFGKLENGRYFVDLRHPGGGSPPHVRDFGHLPSRVSDTPSGTPSDRVSDTPTDTPSDTPPATLTDRVSDTPSGTPSDRVSDTPTDTPSDTPTNGSSGASFAAIADTGTKPEPNNVVPLQPAVRDFGHLQSRVSDRVSDRVGTLRDQRSEIRDQRSEIRDQRSEIRDQRSEIRDQRSEIPDAPAGADPSSPRTLVEQNLLRLPERDGNPTCDVATYLRDYAAEMRTSECVSQLDLTPGQVDVAFDAMALKCFGKKRLTAWDKTARNYLATQAEVDRSYTHETDLDSGPRPARPALPGARRNAPPAGKRSKLADAIRKKGAPGA